MKSFIFTRSYKKRAEQLLRKIISKNTQLDDFNSVRRKVYSSEHLKKLLRSQKIYKTYEISSGTSDYPAWSYYIKQAQKDVANQALYGEYSPTKGTVIAREALAYMESSKMRDSKTYESEDFCLTEGSTGAITSTLEYFKTRYPLAHVLIATPNYYIYAFAARYVNLNIKEVVVRTSSERSSTTEAIIASITDNTKLIIITNPTNPTGEIYNTVGLIKLFTLAAKKNITIMIDELFSELIFPKESFIYADQLAEKINTLRNVVIVKGYSKTKNLPGFRVGYVFSKNRDLIDGVSLICQQRQCFPIGSNFTGLICLDALVRSVTNMQMKTPKRKTTTIIKRILQGSPMAHYFNNPSVKMITKLYADYRLYTRKQIQTYDFSYESSLRQLKTVIEQQSPKQAAFNTFVKIKNMDNINYFDFMLNLYITTGVKIEFSPCFGLSQKAWETDPALGFWLRITYGKNKQELRTGISKFLSFTKLYKQNKGKYITTGLFF